MKAYNNFVFTQTFGLLEMFIKMFHDKQKCLHRTKTPSTNYKNTFKNSTFSLVSKQAGIISNTTPHK